MAQSQSIYNAFEPADFDTWKQQVIKEVKSEEAFEKLFKTTQEGITLQPYYYLAGVEDKVLEPANASKNWAIQERIRVSSTKQALEAAHHALKKGADEVVFEVGDDSARQVLSEVKPFVFRLNPDAETLAGSVQADILSHLLNSDDINETAFKNLLASHKGTIEVNGAQYLNAGANTCTELAFTLAHANEYLNAGATDFIFNIAVGSDYFFEIAKLRALRKLWGTLANEYNIDAPAIIHCETALNNKTIYDYNNNILRTSTEAMAAVVGSCDALYVYPYDVLFKQPNEFSSRIARNIQLILKHESHLDKVMDAAHGSYYIESLSQQIAEKSWELFQNIEAKGGWIACFNSGFLQDTIAKQAEATQQLVDNGNRVVLGVNKYPNSNEKMKGEIEEVELYNNKHFPLRRWTEKAEKERLDNE